MNSLIIISAGAYAREIYSWALDASKAGAPYNLKGFLDDRLNVLDDFNCPIPILSSFETYVPSPDDRFLCAIGDPATRKKYVEDALSRGFLFESLVHPTAVVGHCTTLGMGSVVSPMAVLTADVQIGRFSHIGCMSVCSHHNRIGDWVQISGPCGLAGRVVVEEGAFIGAGSTFVPGCRVGAWAYVGAGSVVLRRVKPRVKVFGNPAQPIGVVEDLPVIP